MLYRFSQDKPYDGDFPGDDGFLGFRSDVEREYPLVQQHDVESADLKLAMRVSREVANISGAEISVYQRTDNGDNDDVWDEDPNPTYWAAIVFKAFFAPKTIEAALKVWGADSPV